MSNDTSNFPTITVKIGHQRVKILIILMEIVESLGYEVQYDKRERFFHIILQQVGNFCFGFHFAFERGRLELIWVVYKGKYV